MKSKFFLLLTMLLVICCQNHTGCIVRQWLGKTITLYRMIPFMLLSFKL